MLALFIIGLCCVLACVANIIVDENKLTGSSDWWYSQPHINSYQIEGFLDRMSYVGGNTIHFKIQTGDPSIKFSLRIYRLGYYGGLGARLIASFGSNNTKPQPNCTFTSSFRSTDCLNWHISSSWTIPITATSGVYVALPVFQNNKPNDEGTYMPFVVKQSMIVTNKNHFKIKGSDILFKTSDLTWLAYNMYGGYNVYKSKNDSSFSARASQASFNRPFHNRLTYPFGQHENFLFGSEYAMIYWLEKHGYDVSYIACEDLEVLHAANLLTPSNYRALLSVGHDEYWTQGMKDAFIAARNQGVNLAFFSGNEGFWRVMWADPIKTDTKDLADYYNRAKRTKSYHRKIICRKETIENTAPASADQWTGTFVDPRRRPADPENSLTGQLFMVNSFRNEPIELNRDHLMLWFWRNFSAVNGSFDEFTAQQNQHRTNISHEDGSVPRSIYISPRGYVGYEMDIFVDDCYRPAGLIALSHTERNIKEALSETYGASYRGSGTVSHKLTMYRHIVHSPSATHSLTHNSNVTSEMMNVCQSKRLFSPSVASSVSALVFGAGTIQWSWALSEWHDGNPTPSDPVVQQATLNLLADMKAMPGSFHSNISKSHLHLVYPTISHDDIPPFSVITTSRHNHISNVMHRHSMVHIKGFAYDKGGGRVAGVEVSLNGGKNWHLASGRERWKFSFKVGDDFKDRKYGTHNCSAMNTQYMAETRMADTGGAVIGAYRDNLINSRRLYDPYSAHKYTFTNNSMTLLILSRAVDDRGWMEEVSYNRVFCGVFTNNSASVKESRNALLMNIFLAA